MKKNKMMRIAAVLLIVTLLSTCAISGTFAKYVTKGAYEDSARVAKWGIKIETSGDLFAEKYAAEDDDYITAGGTYSVDAADDTFVVAPGTSSDQVENGGFVAKVYGTPEVATRFTLTLANLTDIVVPFGTYPDYSVAVVDGQAQSFDYQVPAAVAGLNNNYVTGYAPVKWDVTVTRMDANGNPTNRSLNLVEKAQEVAAGMGLEDLCDALVTDDGVSITDAKTIAQQIANRPALKQQLLNAISQEYQSLLNTRNLVIDIDNDGVVTLSLDFDPNSNVNYMFEGKWTWAFEQTAPSFLVQQGAEYAAAYEETCDKLDTLLGNVAAGLVTVDEAPGVSTVLNFGFEASAVQID